MKFKWYLSVVIAILSLYVGFYAGTIIERVNEHEDLTKSFNHATQQYDKLRKVNKTKFNSAQKDSINRLEYWWIGYKTAIKKEQAKIVNRSQ